MNVVEHTKPGVKQEKSLTLPEVKRRCRKDPSIGTITALARLIPCSTPVIYFAIERPTRYSRVFRRIQEILK